MQFIEWIFEMGVVVGALTPFVNIMTKISESFGLSGNAQLGFALFFGGSLGGFAFIALNGVPVDTIGYFFLVLQVLAAAGMPVGFYQAIKK
jgi:hypothetical protein